MCAAARTVNTCDVESYVPFYDDRHCVMLTSLNSHH